MFCVLNCRNVSNIYMKKLITIALTILPLFLSAQNDSVISNIYKRAGYDELYSELYKKDNWKKYFESKGMYKIDNSIYAVISPFVNFDEIKNVMVITDFDGQGGLNTD